MSQETSAPVPAQGASIQERLEYVRESVAHAASLRAFWRLVTQEAPGRAMWGVSYDAVRTWHIDGREPPAAYLRRLAEVFGVRLQWLIQGIGAPTVAEGALATAEQDADDEAATSVRALQEAFPPFATLAPHVRMLVFAVLGRMAPGWGPAAARRLGRALEVPLRALELDPPSDDAVGRYVVGMCATLGALLPAEEVRRRALAQDDLEVGHGPA